MDSVEKLESDSESGLRSRLVRYGRKSETIQRETESSRWTMGSKEKWSDVLESESVRVREIGERRSVRARWRQ